MTEHDEIVMLFRRYLEHLSGKHNQKSHGNRFGSYGAAKSSLRRLKGDKEAREKYKAKARKKAGMSAKKGKPRTKKAAPSFEKMDQVLEKDVYRTSKGEYRTKLLTQAIKKNNQILSQLRKHYDKGEVGGIFGNPKVRELERQTSQLRGQIAKTEKAITAIVQRQRQQRYKKYGTTDPLVGNK